ncbi:S8 family serine peptidase [Candidatus Uabimicrobium amorphum]|uniref:Peptidase S8 n=1 Tax=Uabimicrobium amorphum TaxID=2596890 RepID=A0A5S9IS36_UABAM|nr:alpha/beta hydrolase [Candidatus Uabimicrobium amorphum]BBM86576.1 peptidase S8 [Candidatus Uabimicrobium amorphum]
MSKRQKLTVFCLCFLSLTINVFAKDYYAFGKKVKLTPSKKGCIVKFEKIFKLEPILESSESDVAISRIDDRTIYVRNLDDSSQFIEDVKDDQSITSVYPIYTLDDGFELGMTNEILVKFKKNVSENELNALKERLELTAIQKTSFYEILTTPKKNHVLDIVNSLEESGLVDYAHANFLVAVQQQNFIPNDEYFARQFSLHNTGQVINEHAGTADADIDAPEAWGLTTGSEEITVAVIDEGVSLNHPDLPRRRLVVIDGCNFADGNPNDPSPKRDGNHGNACAGLVAAEQNNGIGISGVAPNCKIMPIRIPFGRNIPLSKYVNAIDFAWQNGADVISNSWAFRTTIEIPSISRAINRAINRGRQGKGCVVLFSAGNTANHASNNRGRVLTPANVPGVITVGASDRNDFQANYSPTSRLIDVVAPSHRAYATQIRNESFEVWSIDIPGARGKNPGKTSPHRNEIRPNSGSNPLSYTARFGGTSASCPIVAGVAALILSVDAQLTQRQVFQMITSTADKVKPNENRYINGRSSKVGFGRVNAFAAVQKAMRIDTNVDAVPQEAEISETTVEVQEPYIFSGERLLSILNVLSRDGRFGYSIASDYKLNQKIYGKYYTSPLETAEYLLSQEKVSYRLENVKGRPYLFISAEPSTIDAVAASDSQTRENVAVDVYYGTNRNRLNGGYGNQLSSLDMGVCRVSIPKAHKLGVIERPSIFRFEFRENIDKHFILKSVQPLNDASFINGIRSRTREALIYIHGFNVSFQEGVFTTAQVGWDLGFDGTLIMFSWPSNGRVLNYDSDAKDAKESIDEFVTFLSKIKKEGNFTAINIIAHSMGNRVMTNGFVSLLENDQISQPITNNIILAAPDMNVDTFKNEVLPKFQGASKRVTLYASSNDKALRISRSPIYNNTSRLGLGGASIFVARGIDTIDASNVSTTFSGHSYFSNSKNVIIDMRMILRDKSPQQRRVLHQNYLRKSKQGVIYWAFKN